MLKALWNGATGMKAQSEKLDSIANNMANVNTTGYKKNQTNFKDLVYQVINQVGNPVRARSTEGKIPQSGNGVQISSTAKLFSQGNLQETGRPLDLAIAGLGLFAVWLPSGERMYTRNGNFYVNSKGVLVNSLGEVETESEVLIPSDTKEIMISPIGQISITRVNGETEVLGQIKAYKFQNLSGLEAIGENGYKETDSSGEPIEGFFGDTGYGVVNQGFLEGSNVDLTEEMAQLIETQKAYQLNSRSIKTSDEMWSLANNIRK